MNIAEAIADCVARAGIQRAYGLPGEDHMTLLDALDAAGVDYCAAFNESAAALMAGADAQLTQRPGVVILSLAPGISNGINGLLNALMDEIPLVLLSGQHPGAHQPFVVRQACDLERLVAPVVKWSTRVTAATDVVGVMAKAFDIATSGRPGPVFVEIADEVAVADARPGRPSAVFDELRARWAGGPAATPPAPAALASLTARVAAAERPVLVIGGRRPIDPKLAAAVAGELRCPVFTTSSQKGLLDSSHDYFAGTFLNGSQEGRLLDRADLVLMLQPEGFDHYNRPWSFTAHSVAVIDPTFTEWLHDFGERMIGDPNVVLAVLAALTQGASEWTPTDVADYRTDLRSTLLDDSLGGMSVAHAVEAALRAWPRDGFVVADAGFSKPLVAMLSDPSTTGRYLVSNGLSTMGYTIPAATAARRTGTAPVLGFLGDGSLLMRATELMVSPGDPVPAVFVVTADRALTQIEVKQERRELTNVGVTLPAFSCVQLGAALGIVGHDADTPQEVEAAVRDGLADPGRIHLVGARVDAATSRPLFEVLRG